MSRSSKSRGQTEPLAAILAVSIFVIALGMYVMATQPLLPGSSDEATADQTIDRIWNDVEEDGIFHAYPGSDDISDLVEHESIPGGSSVYVSVTAIENGAERTVDEAAFPSGYASDTSQSDITELEQYIADEGTPDDASVATRSIPVAVESRADVRSGTLRVEVW
ncbi:DUF7285 family protein [Halopiger goleimassiliensis]|uniref:DUF7285 family protein n=1 Tax=Halopiger goleimassiliensis TaxID=1293048 RepID=UPI000678074D|nr:hypothetical protein [Halopiger goleimassiliensis]